MKSLASYLSFTGQAGCYAELPLDVLAGATTFTIEAKIATTSTKSSSDNYLWATIIGREIDNYWQDDFGFCVNNGKLCFWAEPQSHSGATYSGYKTNAVVNDGEIHKVAVTCSNGDTFDIYCDGANVAHFTSLRAKITANYKIGIAYNLGDSNSYLQMDLYELRLWNVARSAEEIFADIMGTETGLQGWYLPTVDGLKDYSGNGRHATLYGSPAYTKPTLKAWLPFDESATLDRCGNEWTAYGTTSIDATNAISGQALQLNKGYLRSDTAIEFGGTDFTVNFYGYMNSSSEQWAGFFCAQSTTNTLGGSRRGQIAFHRNNTANTLVCDCYDANGSKLCDVTLSNTNWLNGRHHFELDYSHATSTLKIFIDGRLSLTQTITLERLSRYIFLGVNSYDPPVQRMVGTIDEFRLFDGVALHTTDFTPPTSADYAELSLSLGYPATLEKTFDVERKLSNVVEFTVDVERTVIAAWRYFNAGTATTLTVEGTTLENLSADKSVTGTAFYQTARAKCFDLPSTAEIWIKFDVYFNGSARWRAYNDKNGEICGVCSYVDYANGDFGMWQNNNRVRDWLGVCKVNQLQTVLLHMISDTTAGTIEAWVDDTKIYTYTGNVNHGEDFADIYLQSDGAGTFFSNVIISNKRLTQADGYQKFTADVERVVKNEFSVDFSVDVVRLLNLEMVADEFLHNLTAWLTFDKTQTFDVKLNTWTAYGDLTISETGAISGKALQFNGRGFVVMSETIKFWQRQPFAIGCWFSGTSGKQNAATDATLWILHALDSRADIYVGIDADGILWLVVHHFNVGTSKSILDGKKHYVEVDFDGFAFYLFVDGVLIGELRNIYFSPEREYQLYVGGMSISDPRYAYLFKMTLDEFIFFDNAVMHTEDFSPPTSADYDFYKSIPISSSFCVDVERRITGQVNIEIFADTVIYDVLSVIFATDVIICDAMPANFAADVEILDVCIVEFIADVNRAVKAKLRLFAIDTSGYFSGGTRRNLLRDSTSPEATVIPPQETIPAAPDNTNGLQSIEISLGEQQLTDNVSFVGVVPFDIMFPVQGQYLDYVFDMRVERVQQKGVLYTCDCCVDVDQLLYTQIAYTVPKSTNWHSAGESTATTTDEEEKYYTLNEHAFGIAGALRKTAVVQLDDMETTIKPENLGGSTYADIIREIFGWSSRIPTRLINVFIRNDKIYFIQRGHEVNLLDLTGTKHTIPIVTHELVRMTWGSTPWSKTETHEIKHLRFQQTEKDAGPTDEPTESDVVLVAGDRFDGYPESGYVNYRYDKRGLLIQTVTYVHNHETGKNTYSTVNQDYDDEGTLIFSNTFVQSMDGPDGYSSSQTIIRKGYIKLPNGEKFLSVESSETYASDHDLTPYDLVESRTVIHSPTRAGQGRATVIEDGEFSGGIVGQNTGDDRVTPFAQLKAVELVENVQNGEWVEDTSKLERTLNGLELYDSSFPIHSKDALAALTNSIAWLNRRTKETVTMTIYEYPHLIDFNDRILFNGAEYFLVSNVAMTNARVFNEQRVTFVRWY